jgi:hypothetical protein
VHWSLYTSYNHTPVVVVEGLELGVVPVKGRDVLAPDTPERADLEDLSCTTRAFSIIISTESKSHALVTVRSLAFAFGDGGSNPFCTSAIYGVYAYSAHARCRDTHAADLELCEEGAALGEVVRAERLLEVVEQRPERCHEGVRRRRTETRERASGRASATLPLPILLKPWIASTSSSSSMARSTSASVCTV